MPYKSEKIKIAGGKYDRRIKLTEQDKEDIRNIKNMSIRAIARLYGVDHRLIQFVLFPERHERNKKLRAERGGSKIYYDREKNTKAERETRNYKQELYVKKKIFLSEK